MHNGAEGEGRTHMPLSRRQLSKLLQYLYATSADLHPLFLLNNKLDYRTQDFTISIYNVGALATRNGFEPSKFLLERQVTLPVCLTGHKWWMRKDSNFRCIQRHRFTVCCLRRLATHPYGISGRIRTCDIIRMKDAY